MLISRHAVCIVVSWAALAAACTSDADKQDRPTVDSSIPDASAVDAALRDAGALADAAAGGADSGEIPAVSCNVVLPRACDEPKPTYADVAPIFEQRCAICHNGRAGSNWPLTSYGHVADWQEEIREMVSRCTMPPPDAGIPITDTERDEILMWLRCGLAR